MKRKKIFNSHHNPMNQPYSTQFYLYLSEINNQPDCHFEIHSLKKAILKLSTLAYLAFVEIEMDSAIKNKSYAIADSGLDCLDMILFSLINIGLTKLHACDEMKHICNQIVDLPNLDIELVKLSLIEL